MFLLLKAKLLHSSKWDGVDELPGGDLENLKEYVFM